jgi:hypothetical protein
MKTFDKETPLPQQTRESHVGGDRKSNNRLPQARRCSRPLVFRLAGYSRGQVGNVTSPIQPDSQQFDGQPSAFSHIGAADGFLSKVWQAACIQKGMPKQDDSGIRTYATVSPKEKGGGTGSAGQSGDTQGLSDRAEAGPLSVEELLEEGQSFEAEAIGGVEDAPDPDVAEVYTKQVPEDDVPSEYLGSD